MFTKVIYRFVSYFRSNKCLSLAMIKMKMIITVEQIEINTIHTKYPFFVFSRNFTGSK